MLAPFACDPHNSRGRLYEESTTPYRNEFQRDKDRIIHSNAFRRLEYTNFLTHNRSIRNSVIIEEVFTHY